MKTLIILLFMSQTALAADWLCTEEASQRQGNSIFACGIGTGADENAARLNAFDSAKAEFNKVCNNSDDCNGKQVAISPKRTQCQQYENGTNKCYRLLVFTIGAGRMGAGQVNRIMQAQNMDTSDNFQPFVYNPLATQVKIGMKKAQVLKIFGAPSDASSYSPILKIQSLEYRGKMCMDTSCSVHLTSGKVDYTVGFKVMYTDNLN